MSNGIERILIYDLPILKIFKIEKTSWHIRSSFSSMAFELFLDIPAI